MATTQEGSRGQDVRDLQNALNLLSVTKPFIAVDGVFGPETTFAVKKFQKKDGLTPDGVAGPITISEIKRLLGGTFPAAPADAQVRVDAANAVVAENAVQAAAAQQSGVSPVVVGAAVLLVGVGLAKAAKMW